MSKPRFMGKNPCFITLWFSTLVICHPFVSSNLVNLFNAQLVVEELWLGELLLKWWWLWQAVSLTQLPTPPTLPILLPHALFLGQFTLPRFWVCWLLTHRFWGRFGLTQVFFLSPHELLSTHELQIHVLPVSGASTGKNGAVFPHAGPPLSVPFIAGSDCLPMRMYSSVWGAQ